MIDTTVGSTRYCSYEVAKECHLVDSRRWRRLGQSEHERVQNACDFEGARRVSVRGYMISYLTRKIPRRFTTLYYTLPPNNTLSGLKQIKNDYDTNVMYDIAKVAGKIQLFVSHHQIDLSTVLIPNDGSLEEAFADDARKTIISNLQRELEAEATLQNTMLGNLTRYFEQMRIREIQITMLQNMPTMSLNSYGLHALLMTHEADIRTTNNLIRARQELLRSIAEKQNFINNYRAI
ncbi:hypothetical protein Tco_0349686 [Tanacetum coccineum]